MGGELIASKATGDEPDMAVSTTAQKARIKSTAVAPPAAKAGRVRFDSIHKKVLLPKIVFQGTNEDELSSASQQLLTELAAQLKEYPTTELRIETHTDSLGSDQANLDKTQRQAEALKKILINAGIPANRLQTLGKGDKTPLGDDRTVIGREKNRRVEFSFTGDLTAPQKPVAATPPPTPPAPPPPANPVLPTVAETQPTVAPTTAPIIPNPVALPSPESQPSRPEPQAAPIITGIPVAALPETQPNTFPIPATPPRPFPTGLPTTLPSTLNPAIPSPPPVAIPPVGLPTALPPTGSIPIVSVPIPTAPAPETRP